MWMCRPKLGRVLNDHDALVMRNEPSMVVSSVVLPLPVPPLIKYGRRLVTMAASSSAPSGETQSRRDQIGERHRSLAECSQ